VGEITTDPNDNQRVSYAESLTVSLADPKKEGDKNKHAQFNANGCGGIGMTTGANQWASSNG